MRNCAKEWHSPEQITVSYVMDTCVQYAANNPCMPTHMFASPDIYHALMTVFAKDWTSMQFRPYRGHNHSVIELYTAVGPVKVLITPKYRNLMLVGLHDALQIFEEDGPPYEFLCEQERLILDQIVEQELLGDQ